MIGGMLGVGGLVGGLVTLILGIVILVWPKFLAVVIGLWLIIVGIVAIVSSFG